MFIRIIQEKDTIDGDVIPAGALLEVAPFGCEGGVWTVFKSPSLGNTSMYAVFGPHEYEITDATPDRNTPRIFQRQVEENERPRFSRKKKR